MRNGFLIISTGGRTGSFPARAFTSRKRLEEFARDHGIDVLLTGTLSEGGFPGLPSVQRILLTEEEVRAGEGGGHGIYKYQSGDDILREVMAAYCETPEGKTDFPGLPASGKRIIGVYSPVGRCGKTSLALAMGQLLAREEKLLFITLDTFTGFSGLLDEQWKRDLSDLIYYYKQAGSTAFSLIRSFTIWEIWPGCLRSVFRMIITRSLQRKWRIFC